MTDQYRVVLAEDVAQLRELLGIVLQRSSRFTVVAEAANGEQAVAAAIEHQPDLTLLDLSMPVMDGLEALPRIRAAVPSCAVVVLSGFDADRMSRRAMTAGAAAYLVKGIHPDDLVTQLLEILQGGGDGADPPDSAPEPPSPYDVALQLPGHPSSLAAVRKFVRHTLSEWSRERLVDEAELLATELVANAIMHAGSGVDVRIRGLENAVRVEVADTGSGALTLKTPAAESTSGRGLLLVEALARSWGTSADGHRKIVWFEL